MPPQVDTHLPLLLEPRLLDGINRALLGFECQFCFLLGDGSVYYSPMDTSASFQNLDWLSRKEPKSPEGLLVTYQDLSIPQGDLGQLVQIRSSKSQAPDLGAVAADLICKEASLRFELQSTLEELVAKYEELTVVYDSAETVVSITDLDGVSQKILDQAADILDVDHASLMLIEGSNMVIKASRGSRSDMVGRLFPIPGLNDEGLDEPHRHISGYVAREGKPVLIEDLTKDPVFGRNFNRDSDHARSLVSVPIKIKDRVLGILNVNHKRSGEPFNSGDLKLLMALASLAAISIENARTYQNAITDRLTSLYNYGYFREQLDKALQQAREGSSTLCLIMFDIDHFKNFNDVNGHELANVALVGVSSLCLTSSRQKGDRVPDLVARYGGEEFMIMLAGVSKESARQTAERIRHKVETAHFEGGQNQPMGKVTISMGVAIYPEDAQTPEELINAADQALYQAKRSGRNNVKLA